MTESSAHKTEEEIRDALRGYFRAHVGDRPLADDEVLADRGFVASLELIELVVFVEDQFGLVLEAQDVIPDNLRTVASLARTIHARQR